jgi:hypothetical protein
MIQPSRAAGCHAAATTQFLRELRLGGRRLLLQRLGSRMLFVRAYPRETQEMRIRDRPIESCAIGAIRVI